MNMVIRSLLCANLALLIFSSTISASPPTHEQQIINANRTEASYNSNPKLVRTASLDSYLSNLVQRIITNEPNTASINFRIHAMQNALPYAYCLDNGAIYVSTGLIARLQNESQLAGLIAPEIASVFRQDSDSRNHLTQKQQATSRVVPNILLVVFTGGLAGIPIASKDQKETSELNAKLQLESDQLGFKWLQQAGFNLNEASRAPQRLLDVLTAENRYGNTNLSSQAGLAARTTELTNAFSKTITPLSETTTSAPEVITPATKLDNTEFIKIARQFSIELAEDERQISNNSRFYAIMDRIDGELGKDGVTAFLRAEFLRENTIDEQHFPDVIRSYEFCITFTNAPDEAWRELGYLNRKQGNKLAAKQNFETYLKRKPTAVDASIVRSYMESL